MSHSVASFENHRKIIADEDDGFISNAMMHLKDLNNIAQLVYQSNQQNLRPVYFKTWAGENGRLQKEVNILENIFKNCIIQEIWSHTKILLMII